MQCRIALPQAETMAMGNFSNWVVCVLYAVKFHRKVQMHDTVLLCSAISMQVHTYTACRTVVVPASQGNCCYVLHTFGNYSITSGLKSKVYN